MQTHARRMFVLCLSAAVTLAPAAFGAAAKKQPQTQDWSTIKAAKAAEGWVEVAPGVLERTLGNRVEHLGYGEQGLAWSIHEMERQLAFLEQEQRSHPSAELTRTIHELNDKLAQSRLDLLALSVSSSSASAPAVTGGSCTSICYSATASAYPLTSAQGVGATASATFNSSCGYSGSTYAYAYARATLGTTTTIITQSDPKSGNPISSYASASVNGGSVSGTPCYSSASSYAQSTALGIYYDTSATNSLCPPAPMTVTISGTNYENFNLANCRSKTWTSTVSGGNGVYSYQWLRGSTVVSTASSYTGSVCYYDDPGFTLTLNVSDSNGASGSKAYSVTVIDNTGGCGTCGCFGIICP